MAVAFVEKYVTTGGTEAWATNSIGSPSSLAEAFANGVAGERVNILKGSYTVSGVTLGAGTASAAIVFRGYSVTPGDLDNLQRTEGGLLPQTNLPTITMSSTSDRIVVGHYNKFINLVITGKYQTSYGFGSSSADGVSLINCVLDYDGTANTNYTSIQLDNYASIINCDFLMTNEKQSCLRVDIGALIIGCVFKPAGATQRGLQMQTGIVRECAFIGTSNAGAGYAIAGFTTRNEINEIENCTFYRWGSGLRLSSTGIPPNNFIRVTNNYFEDMGEAIYNENAASVVCFLQNNVFYNNTTDIATDIISLTEDNSVAASVSELEDVGNDDYRLTSDAVGRNTGAILSRSVGAHQPSTGGAAGGTIGHAF